jgi:lipid-A-disaccharide synthase
VEFVGHPLIDAIHNRVEKSQTDFIRENGLEDKPIIAILPGSRKQEITKMLSVMLSVATDFPGYQFVIAGAPSQERALYEPFLKNKQVHLLANKTYDLLSHATAALVTSGTATLETALFQGSESGLLQRQLGIIPDRQTHHYAQVHFTGKPDYGSRSRHRTHPG